MAGVSGGGKIAVLLCILVIVYPPLIPSQERIFCIPLLGGARGGFLY